ncbi:protein flp [Diplogelasinospora grovesii]|uniref:Protein flp n=1 Tax=Diplogelasinospora grovesii TaxID=303347 RepID=A0AAN6N175_9PEZI|nr:protein flp [Diplogelasinospora grovesii]
MVLFPAALGFVLLATSIFAASRRSSTLNRLQQARASIGVIHHGEIIHIYNYGYSHSKTKSPTTSDTVYSIGSLTKSFITAAIAKLVDEGRLTWDTRVKDILPEFHQEDPTVYELTTMTDILSHRCGLAGLGAMNMAFQGDGDMLLPKDSLFKVFGRFPVLFPCRQSWSYFVWRYSLAGAIIETVTKKSVKEYLSETIFKPLGIDDTTFSPGSLELGKLAEPFAGLSDGIFEDTFFEASGGMYSSTNDMMAWASEMLRAINGTSKELVRSSWVVKDVPSILSDHAAIANPSISDLGWVRTQLPGVEIKDSPLLGSKDRSLLMIYHQGATVSYYSFIALFPETDSAVVVLTNAISLSDTADWIARALIQDLFNFTDSRDYAALTKEANKRALGEFEQLSAEINSLRAACLDSDLSPLTINSFTYELRYLCKSTFKWSLTHNELKKRGRYNAALTTFYLLEFEVHGDTSNPDLLKSVEVFKRDE